MDRYTWIIVLVGWRKRFDTYLAELILERRVLARRDGTRSRGSAAGPVHARLVRQRDRKGRAFLTPQPPNLTVVHLRAKSVQQEVLREIVESCTWLRAFQSLFALLSTCLDRLEVQENSSLPRQKVSTTLLFRRITYTLLCLYCTGIYKVS